MQMEPQRTNWRDLSDPQKNIRLEQAKTFLQQQVVEAKLRNNALKVLHKHELIE